MKSSKQNKSINQQNSVLENLRDLGSDVLGSLKEDLVKKGSEDIFNSLFPFNQPQSQLSEKTKGELNKPLAPDKESNLKKKEQLILKRIEIIHHEEKILFTREQRETQQQVSALQEEIQKLALSTAKLASEANQAQIVALQETPSAGKYHLNLFEKIRMILTKIRSQIEESSFWLAAWTKKAQKRNYYWGQFKKSGSKFLLSSDRYVSTQAG